MDDHIQVIIMYYLRKVAYKEKGLFWFASFGDYSPKWSRFIDVCLHVGVHGMVAVWECMAKKTVSFIEAK